MGLAKWGKNSRYDAGANIAEKSMENKRKGRFLLQKAPKNRRKRAFGTKWPVFVIFILSSLAEL